MFSITKIKILDAYKIWMQFNDGLEKIIDFTPYIGKGLAAELLDIDNFKKVKVEKVGGLTWYNGYDFCPNFLHDVAKKQIKTDNYLTFKEKQDFFEAHKIINSETELDSIFQGLEDQDFIFRGQIEAKWKLYNKAQRDLNTDNADTFKNKISEKIRLLEKWNNNILKKYHKTVFPKDGTPTALFYLSHLQHYGNISPLLDFTSDWRVGLFFAIDGLSIPEDNWQDENSIGNYFSVYFMKKESIKPLVNDSQNYSFPILNPPTIQDNQNTSPSFETVANPVILQDLLGIDELFKQSYGVVDSPDYRQNQPETILNPQNNYFETKSHHLINHRFIAQKGLFVFNSSPDKSLEDQIKKKITCIDIHKKLLPFIKHELDKSNYSIKTIYPDFDEIKHL